MFPFYVCLFLHELKLANVRPERQSSHKGAHTFRKFKFILGKVGSGVYTAANCNNSNCHLQCTTVRVHAGTYFKVDKVALVNEIGKLSKVRRKAVQCSAV